MNERPKPQGVSISAIIMMTFVSGIVAVIVSVLILPAIVTNLTPTLDSLNIVGVSNLVGWISEIIIFLTLGIVTLLLSNYYKINIMITSFFASFITGIALICLFSFLISSHLDSSLYAGLTIFEKMFKFYIYPSVLTIQLGSPTAVWIGSTFIHMILFIFKFYQLTGDNKQR